MCLVNKQNLLVIDCRLNWLLFPSYRPSSSEPSSTGKKNDTFYSSSSEDEDETGSSDSCSDSVSENSSDSSETSSNVDSGDDDDIDDSVNISQQNIIRLSPSLSPSSPSQRLSRQLVIRSSDSESDYTSSSSESEKSITDLVQVPSKETISTAPKSNVDLLLDLEGKLHDTSCISYQLSS